MKGAGDQHGLIFGPCENFMKMSFSGNFLQIDGIHSMVILSPHIDQSNLLIEGNNHSQNS